MQDTSPENSPVTEKQPEQPKSVPADVALLFAAIVLIGIAIFASL